MGEIASEEQNQRSQTLDHASCCTGPWPTSCARNWWPDLKQLLAQLDQKSNDYTRAEAIRSGGKIAIADAFRRYPLYVNKFFMKRAKPFMGTVFKKALGILHYWGRVEYAPGRGAINLHSIGIASDKGYLRDFYCASTHEEKAAVLDKYA
jgi:hypothetical protein